MKTLRIALLAGLLCLGVPLWVWSQQPSLPAGPTAATGNPPALGRGGARRIQVLVITGQSYPHDWIDTTPLLKKALEDTGHFEVRVTEELRSAGPGTWRPMT